MKKIQIMGWLVMAAAFITTFTACSSDDNIDESKAPVRTVSVTVGAGIIDDAITRSGIIEGKNDQDKTTRTLKFTTGDKLFVRAMYGGFVQDKLNNEYYDYMLRGFLTMVSSPTNEGKSASFTGTLTQYNRGEENSIDGYEYAEAGNITVSYNSDDPLSGDNVKKVFATLVHKDATLDTDYTDEDYNIYYNWFKLAPDVNSLMTKNLAVTSSSEGTGYNSSTKSFTLRDAPNPPILNCTISGLTPDATYTVTYDVDGTYYDVTFDDKVTANARGVATFAFFGSEDSSDHALIFVRSSPGEIKTANLGNKRLSESFKIFNVSRTATAN